MSLARNVNTCHWQGMLTHVSHLHMKVYIGWVNHDVGNANDSLVKQRVVDMFVQPWNAEMNNP